MSYTYEYPRPSLTVDCVVFGWDGQALKVLLILRKEPPFRQQWALPGGFVRMEESLDEAALRELQEETGLRDVYMEQLYTMGTPGRDPRGRVVSVAYYALLRRDAQELHADTDAEDADWFDVNDLPPLAFDHAEILRIALARIRGKVRYSPVGFNLLEKKFTLSELQNLYETILGRELDKRNFRKKIKSTGLVEELDELQQGVPHRAARMHRFNEAAYRKLEETGFEFRL